MSANFFYFRGEEDTFSGKRKNMYPVLICKRGTGGVHKYVFEKPSIEGESRKSKGQVGKRTKRGLFSEAHVIGKR